MTDLRLGEYNGLHLVHLIAVMGLPMHALVFSNDFDPFLADETRAARAFYEHTYRVVGAAPSYLRASLPQQDRRNPVQVDRRTVPRGGRRAADLAVVSLS